MNISVLAVGPLTPTLSPEYRGEGVCVRPLSRLRERAGVRVFATP